MLTASQSVGLPLAATQRRFPPLTGNQQLWRGISGRIRASTSRLKTLAALARWEERASSATSLAYQHALYEEVLHLLKGLTDHLRVFQF